jgi:hypothetical protein
MEGQQKGKKNKKPRVPICERGAMACVKKKKKKKKKNYKKLHG